MKPGDLIRFNKFAPAWPRICGKLFCEKCPDQPITCSEYGVSKGKIGVILDIYEDPIESCCSDNVANVLVDGTVRYRVHFNKYFSIVD